MPPPVMMPCAERYDARANSEPPKAHRDMSMSACGPPAARIARFCSCIRLSTGVRSNVYFMMFTGVRTNGMMYRAPGVFAMNACSELPLLPRGDVKVPSRAALRASEDMSGVGSVEQLGHALVARRAVEAFACALRYACAFSSPR
jgi:hypothetical protein